MHDAASSTPEEGTRSIISLNHPHPSLLIWSALGVFLAAAHESPFSQKMESCPQIAQTSRRRKGSRTSGLFVTMHAFRYLIATLERVWRVNPSSENMIVILDCRETQFHNYEHAMCMMCNAILSANYPDQIEICIMFPTNWVIKGLVSIARWGAHSKSRNHSQECVDRMRAMNPTHVPGNT